MEPRSQSAQSMQAEGDEAVVRNLFEDAPADGAMVKVPVRSVVLAAMGGICFLLGGLAQYHAPGIATPLQIVGSTTMLLKAASESGLKIQLIRR